MEKSPQRYDSDRQKVAATMVHIPLSTSKFEAEDPAEKLGEARLEIRCTESRQKGLYPQNPLNSVSVPHGMRQLM